MGIRQERKEIESKAVIIIHKGLKGLVQIHAILIEKLKFAEGAEYQTKLEKLKQDIELPESIYKAFKEKYENISKQIGVVESLVVKQE